MNIEYFELPVHWASALINGDDSLDESETEAFDAFCNWMEEEYGQCWCLDVDEDTSFTQWHDARDFGVLACEVSRFAFDVTARS